MNFQFPTPLLSSSPKKKESPLETLLKNYKFEAITEIDVMRCGYTVVGNNPKKTIQYHYDREKTNI